MSRSCLHCARLEAGERARVRCRLNNNKAGSEGPRTGERAFIRSFVRSFADGGFIWLRRLPKLAAGSARDANSASRQRALEFKAHAEGRLARSPIRARNGNNLASEEEQRWTQGSALREAARRCGRPTKLARASALREPSLCTCVCAFVCLCVRQTSCKKRQPSRRRRPKGTTDEGADLSAAGDAC